MQAYALAQQYGPLKSWTGSHRTLAGRLASNLGAERLSAVLHWLAWRSNKSDPDLAAYQAHTLLRRRGPLAAYEFTERFGDVAANGGPDGKIHFLSLRATIAAYWRDFEAAEAYLESASKFGEHPWLPVSQSRVYELQDRYLEALAAGQRALELRPWYRPGVQAVAHALQLLDRDEEALALLTEAASRLENLHILQQLAVLQQDRGLYAEASVSLKKFADLAPLMEESERLWLLRQRVTLDCQRGDYAAALAGARQVDEPYYRELVERLEHSSNRGRIRLEVPFVRQHHMTCAPATLAAISRFWKLPAEHLDIAEAICYDGTPAHSERAWAESHGWAAREFTVTWNAAVALLDRGIPFTLTTSDATSGHLQAVVGYDELRQTLWIRDPFIYYASEFAAKPLFERHRPTGPRGMALVPAARRDLLDGIDLPDAQLYDHLYQVQHALAEHRRSDAAQTCLAMQSAAPEHRLTLTARRAIAAYDGNTPAHLEALNQLLEQFPEDGNLNLCKLSSLRELARRDERLRLLENRCTTRAVEPVFWQLYAQELRADGRQRGAAATWVRWSLRYRPVDPTAISAWADILWDEREFSRATVYYRLAAFIGDKREQHSQSFFAASRHLRQTESALAFLKKRHERLGARSAAPAITLIESLGALGRSKEADHFLEAALQQRPNDGDLHLFAADFYTRSSRVDDAQKWLRKAAECCRPVAWHRCAARLADYRNDRPTALVHWREVLDREPLADDALRAVTTLLAETEGREIALKFLADRSAQFPFSCPLLVLRAQWSKADGAEATIPHLRALLDVNPADAWAWRELALELSNARQPDAAFDAAQEAIRVEPNHSAGLSVRADLLFQSGRIAEARADWREALRLEVDNAYVLSRYVESGATLADRKAALAEVASELRRQVIFHNALSAYRDAARGLLPGDEVLQLLREANLARPDLWQSWSVYANQLVDVGRHEEALQICSGATQRFPLVPRIWVDLARVEQARLNSSGEIAALQKALELAPNYAFAARQLASVHERTNNLVQARTVIEQAIATSPLDADNQGCLAHLLWKLNERDAALARVQHALRLQPGYSWAWSALREWGEEAGRQDLAAEMARDLTRNRAGEARAWLMLARSLSPSRNADEFFAALDRALALNPRADDAYDQRARALTELNRFDEALAVCDSWPFTPKPANLKLRAVWIETQRGNVAKAIALANKTLEEHPDHYGGWQLLSDCYLSINEPGQAVKAAEKMVALAPLEAVPLGYLGDLKLRLGEKEHAQAAFERAFVLDPDYHYAGFQLFHLRLQQRKLEEAAKTLTLLERGGETHETQACAVKLATAQHQYTSAQSLFRKLCQNPKAESRSIAAAAAYLDRDVQSRIVDSVLDEVLSGSSCPPAAAEFWVERQIQRNCWHLHRKLKQLHTEGEPGRRAILRYLDGLGEAFNNARARRDVTAPLHLRYCFWRLLRTHRGWLAVDLKGWGKVGYVLTCIGRPKPAVAWLSDWKSRPHAESWMLYNLIIMLQRLKRYDETREVIRHAVGLRHEENLYPIFRLWAAFEEALGWNNTSAKHHLATLSVDRIPDGFRPIHAMTLLLIRVRDEPSATRASLSKTIRKEVSTSFGKRRPCEASQYVRDAYRRFIAVIARETASPAIRWWGWWYYRGAMRLWPLAVLILVPVGFIFPPALVLLIALSVIAVLRRKYSL